MNITVIIIIIVIIILLCCVFSLFVLKSLPNIYVRGGGGIPHKKGNDGKKNKNGDNQQKKNRDNQQGKNKKQNIDKVDFFALGGRLFNFIHSLPKNRGDTLIKVDGKITNAISRTYSNEITKILFDMYNENYLDEQLTVASEFLNKVNGRYDDIVTDNAIEFAILKLKYWKVVDRMFRNFKNIDANGVGTKRAIENRRTKLTRCIDNNLYTTYQMTEEDVKNELNNIIPERLTKNKECVNKLNKLIEEARRLKEEYKTKVNELIDKCDNIYEDKTLKSALTDILNKDLKDLDDYIKNVVEAKDNFGNINALLKGPSKRKGWINIYRPKLNKAYKNGKFKHKYISSQEETPILYTKIYDINNKLISYHNISNDLAKHDTQVNEQSKLDMIIKILNYFAFMKYNRYNDSYGIDNRSYKIAIILVKYIPLDILNNMFNNEKEYENTLGIIITILMGLYNDSRDAFDDSVIKTNTKVQGYTTYNTDQLKDVIDYVNNSTILEKYTDEQKENIVKMLLKLPIETLNKLFNKNNRGKYKSTLLALIILASSLTNDEFNNCIDVINTKPIDILTLENDVDNKLKECIRLVIFKTKSQYNINLPYINIHKLLKNDYINKNEFISSFINGTRGHMLDVILKLSKKEELERNKIKLYKGIEASLSEIEYSLIEICKCRGCSNEVIDYVLEQSNKFYIIDLIKLSETKNEDNTSRLHYLANILIDIKLRSSMAKHVGNSAGTRQSKNDYITENKATIELKTFIRKCCEDNNIDRCDSDIIANLLNTRFKELDNNTVLKNIKNINEEMLKFRNTIIKCCEDNKINDGDEGFYEYIANALMERTEYMDLKAIIGNKTMLLNKIREYNDIIHKLSEYIYNYVKQHTEGGNEETDTEKEERINNTAINILNSNSYTFIINKIGNETILKDYNGETINTIDRFDEAIKEMNKPRYVVVADKKVYELKENIRKCFEKHSDNNEWEPLFDDIVTKLLYERDYDYDKLNSEFSEALNNKNKFNEYVNTIVTSIQQQQMVGEYIYEYMCVNYPHLEDNEDLKNECPEGVVVRVVGILLYAIDYEELKEIIEDRLEKNNYNNDLTKLNDLIKEVIKQILEGN